MSQIEDSSSFRANAPLEYSVCMPRCYVHSDRTRAGAYARLIRTDIPVTADKGMQCAGAKRAFNGTEYGK
jgi:hypothetical protein